MNRARMTTQFSTYVLFSILIVFLLPNLATADIIPIGDIVPTYENLDPWIIAGSLTVGNTADGSIEINSNSHISNMDGYIGYDPTVVGSVTVTGLNSLWESDYIYVGHEGEGTLLIEDGGNVYTHIDHSHIGDMPGSSGSVTVNGQGSLWDNSHHLFVGYEGEGVMLISEGGKVKNIVGGIGEIAGSTGIVTVTGQNSLWENSQQLYVGHMGGEGELWISEGGNVTNTRGVIGREPDSKGSVTVTGQNSLWQNSAQLYVGYLGEGEMLISDGGNVTNTWGAIASEQYSKGSVTVTGQNSLWQNSAQLFVGGSDLNPGGIGLLNISNGGAVEALYVRIWPTGTLSGNGVLKSDSSVENYGTIKPGNSIGTLTIEGNLRMRSDSIYEVEVVNSGNSDLLAVSGNVNIDGGTVKAVSTETISGTKQYTIIEATNNVVGTFDTLDTTLLRTGLWPEVSLDYEPDSVLLQIEATAFDDPSIVQTDNQSSLGRALQRIAGEGGNSITTALQNLESADKVRSAYEQLSGQISPQLTPVTAADTSKFMGIVSDRLNYAGAGLSYYGFSGGPLLAMAEPDKTREDASTSDTSPNFAVGNGTTSFGDQEWGFWGRGYGVFGDRDTGGGVAGYDYTVYGSTFGLDYQITDSSLLGITAGYSSGDVDSSLAGSNSDISGTHIGIYGNKNADDWHFDAIFTYSFLEYETERYVNLMSEKLKGDTDGEGISGYVEARYDWRDLYSWLLQPLASFQISYLDVDSYTESGGASRLAYDDQSYDSYKGSLGMKASRELFKRDNGSSAHIQLRGRWIHEFGDDNSSVNAHFASDPSAVFKVSDADISRDSALLGVGLNAGLSRHTQISFGYDTQLNSDDNMHLLSAMFVYRW